MRWLLYSLVAAAVLRGKPAAEKVASLSATMAKLESSPSAAIAGPAKELHAAAEHALAETGAGQDKDLAEVMTRSRAFLKQLSERSAVLSKEDELDKLSRQAEHLEPKVSPEARAALEKAVQDRSGSELRTALTGAVGDLQAKIAHLSAESRNLTKEVSDDQVQSLLRLLRERRQLPLPTQLAVLRRKEYASYPAAQKLLANHSSAPLYEQLRALFPDAAEPEADVNHDKGVHSASRRVFVVSSRMKHAVAQLRGNLEKVRVELATAVAEKRGGPEAVKQGTAQLAALDALLKDVGSTHDLEKQLQKLDAFEAQLVKQQR